VDRTLVNLNEDEPLNSPFISVIINMRDGAATISETLKSVLTQTFHDLEIVVWDDGSVDESAAIVAAERDPRIRYHRSPEITSLGKARDMAIRIARGKWIAFIDQDDLWTPDKIQKQIARVLGHPTAGLVYGRTLLFRDGCDLRDYDHRHEFEKLPEGDIFEALFRESCFIAMSSAMFRKSALEEIGHIPLKIETIPDYFLFLSVARKFPVLAVQDVICKYRLHEGSMSRSRRRRIHEEALWLIERWEPELDPALAAHRKRIHSTLLILDNLLTLRDIRKSVAAIIRDGSPAFLASRPFAIAARALRRRIRRPYYKRS
jgi:glycosyltransferase involved in cell wall biosynthesis